tara:strand:- start:515 stop:934 length:420 start_codon:yes stop_codon:yes gene_type:complete
MAANLGELSKVVDTLKAASAEVGRLETENVALREELAALKRAYTDLERQSAATSAQNQQAGAAQKEFLSELAQAHSERDTARNELTDLKAQSQSELQKLEKRVAEQQQQMQSSQNELTELRQRQQKVGDLLAQAKSALD